MNLEQAERLSRMLAEQYVGQPITKDMVAKLAGPRIGCTDEAAYFDFARRRVILEFRHEGTFVQARIG